ncbi:serine/threonine protein kinase [Streptomyces sp. 6N223]|uniref:serine/threonine protein kinase n=1 Tax=Streptomyces sp. 6N223 TaxID=3457412 RepID=UPI003FCEECE7
MEPLTAQDPRRIGPYRLLARLGAGGMGTVYLARSDRARTVAVKTIIPELAQEADFRRRFAAEITAARRVGGEWTAPVLDADTEAETPWVATGYIAGPSLWQVVNDHGPLPERSVRLLAGGLAQALKAIHEAGLLHRDLKPSNVLVTIDGPRVIDFGIARALETAPGESITRTGSTVGSPGFMSPEQVSGERNLTPASDVFGLGSLLTFAATGRTPFGALDSGQHVLTYRTVEEEPDLTGVPEDLRGLVRSCLAKEPEQRMPMPELLAYPAPGGGEDRNPWLPAEIVARLGREAISLLESENPETRVGVSAATQAMAAPTPLPERAQESSPASPPAPAPATPQAQAHQQHPQPQSPQPQPAAPSPAPSGPPPYSPPASPADPAPHAASPASPLPGGPPAPYTPQTGGSFGPPPPGTPHYGPSPYAPVPPPGTPSRSRRGLLIGLAIAGALVVLGAVTAVVLASGGDDEERPDDRAGASDEPTDPEGGQSGPPPEDTTPVAEEYLGAWQGEYGSRGQSGWKALWFEISQGQEGESIGKATVTYMDSMCVYDVRLSSFDDQLNFTEVAQHSVPAGEIEENCRADGGIQSLTLQESGALQWNSNDQQTTLVSAGEGGDAVVPETLVGEWYDAYTTDDVENGLDVMTIEQSAVGENMLRWSWTQDETTCVTENELAQVDGERMLISPDILVDAESDDTCEPLGTAWVYVESDGNLYIQWTDDPAGENTYLIQDDNG